MTPQTSARWKMQAAGMLALALLAAAAVAARAAPGEQWADTPRATWRAPLRRSHASALVAPPPAPWHAPGAPMPCARTPAQHGRMEVAARDCGPQARPKARGVKQRGQLIRCLVRRGGRPACKCGQTTSTHHTHLIKAPGDEKMGVWVPLYVDTLKAKDPLVAEYKTLISSVENDPCLKDSFHGACGCGCTRACVWRCMLRGAPGRAHTSAPYAPAPPAARARR